MKRPDVRGGSLAVSVALLLLASLLGCADDGDDGTGPEVVLDPASMRPILQFETDSPEIVAEILAEIRKAGLSAEFRAVTDVSVEDRGPWATKESGWLLFARNDERDRTMAAYDAYIDGLEVVEVRSGSTDAIEPLPLGTAGELEPERVRAIRAELARRVKLDQEIRRDPERHGEMPAVDAANTAWIEDLVREIGWIDVGRFGTEAANAAFLLVQHGGEIPLMKAALPEIEKDVRKGALDAQAYALLYDRLAFMTGGQQRYGTQVVVRESGEQVVERLEDPDSVDARRREIGLSPLATYLDGFGGEVQIER